MLVNFNVPGDYYLILTQIKLTVSISALNFLKFNISIFFCKIKSLKD